MTSQSLISLTVCMGIWLAFWMPIIFFGEIKNFIRFFGKKFSNDSDAIALATSINSNFTNRYSIRYSKDERSWNLIPLTSELDERDYCHIVSKSELIAEVCRLFFQYQHDWMMKDFENIGKYTAAPFCYSSREVAFVFNNNFEIIYNSQLLEAAPISYFYLEERDKHIFQVQINAKMVNFTISARGNVISGESEPRFYSEYWGSGLNSQKELFLMGIYRI